jgi:hypothetical protein
VAQLDQALCLSADQREKLLATLSAGWKDEWGNNMQMLLFGNQALPQIEEAAVVPYLSGAQKTVWGTLPKGRNMFFGGFGMMENNDNAEPELDEAEKALQEDKAEKAPAKVEAKQ